MIEDQLGTKMTKDKQKEFVRNLSYILAEDVCAQITLKKIPEHWGAEELRQILADRHEDGARLSLPFRDKQGAFFKRYLREKKKNKL